MKYELDVTMKILSMPPTESSSNKNGQPWSEQELKFLKEHYPGKGSKYISEALGRTIQAVQQAAKIKGIRNTRSKPWTKQEIEFLRSNYIAKGAATIGKELHRTT